MSHAGGAAASLAWEASILVTCAERSTARCGWVCLGGWVCSVGRLADARDRRPEVGSGGVVCISGAGDGRSWLGVRRELVHCVCGDAAFRGPETLWPRAARPARGARPPRDPVDRHRRKNIRARSTSSRRSPAHERPFQARISKAPRSRLWATSWSTSKRPQPERWPTVRREALRARKSGGAPDVRRRLRDLR